MAGLGDEQDVGWEQGDGDHVSQIDAEIPDLYNQVKGIRGMLVPDSTCFQVETFL